MHPILAMAAPGWWEVMSNVERATFLGGIAGFASVVVTAVIAVDSRKTAKAQLKLAEEANKTTQLAVSSQIEANGITKLSVDDQIVANRAARSASVRIARVWNYSPENADSSNPVTAEYEIHGGDFARILTLLIINDGMAPAYKIRLYPLSVNGNPIVRHHRGYHLTGDDPFASYPEHDYLSLPPGHTAEFRVALRFEATTPITSAAYAVRFEDGNGTHERHYEFAVHANQYLREVPVSLA